MCDRNYSIDLAMELAAEGNKDAMLEVVIHFINNDDKELLVKNIESILIDLSALADDGNGYAMRQLGNLYNEGRGVKQDYKTAIDWFGRAAKASDTYAMCNLGYIYYYGRGAEVDFLKAYKCFAEAAFMKNANAMYKLGDMYYYGNHVKEDKSIAFFWYEEAENYTCYEYEEASVQYRLGKCYLYGHGVESDLSEAYNYLSSAEKSLIQQIEDGDPYGIAKLVLPQAKEEFEKVRYMIYNKLRDSD